jgi:hypothetical protein
MLALLGLALLVAGTSATGPPAEFTASFHCMENAIDQPAATPVLATLVILDGATSLNGGQPASVAVNEHRQNEGEPAREVVAILAPGVAGPYLRAMKTIASYAGHDPESDRDLRRIGPALASTANVLRM